MNWSGACTVPVPPPLKDHMGCSAGRAAAAELADTGSIQNPPDGAAALGATAHIAAEGGGGGVADAACRCSRR